MNKDFKNKIDNISITPFQNKNDEKVFTIKNVVPNSPAERSGIKSGDLLISINGHKIKDVLDYKFYSTEKRLVVKLQSGKNVIRKGQYDDLGLEFDTYLMDEKRHCKNNCVFCFINQLPEGMRDTLYFKDDDTRLSFLQGNYVTLTNLSEQDVERIIKMKLNINISVHTVNPELRVNMLKNPNAGNALNHLYKMAKFGINMNCQIVLCPGINDGDELRKTLDVLIGLYPSVNSIACVPVGLTKHRESLSKLEPFNKATATDALDIIESFGNNMLAKHGNRLVYPADELFLLAERSVPDFDYYTDFSQYENGVGMWACLEREFFDAFDDYSNNFKIENYSPVNKSIATGTAAAPLIEKLVDKLNKNFNKDFNCNVYAIRNDFFGESVNVAGLVTGQDLINQLLPHKDILGNELLIPETMLHSGEDIFLDDVTLEQAEKRLGIKITPVQNDGWKLLEAIIKC